MNFEYSAFEINQIVTELSNNNISLTFENIEDLQRGFEQIFPILLSAKTRNKKYFNPFATLIKYNCMSGEIEYITHQNLYTDSGIMFDDNNRRDIKNITEFLNFYVSLQNLYLFDASKCFGVSFSPDKKFILHYEYNINYIPLHIFIDYELQKFLSYMPKFLQFSNNDIELIKGLDIGLFSFFVNPDNTPQKLEFLLPKQNFIKLINFDLYEGREEIEFLINNKSCGDNLKLGFYFTGDEQNKFSVLFNIDNVDPIFEQNLNIDLNLKQKLLNTQKSEFFYEILWNNEKIIDRSILVHDLHESLLTGG